MAAFRVAVGYHAVLSKGGSMGGRLAILTNIPTPYRVAFFRSLRCEIESRGGSLGVYYCASSERGRKWDLDPQSIEGEVMKGAPIRAFGSSFHINPLVMRAIRPEDWDWVIIAGAWNTPTMLLSTWGLRGKVPRVFWSEGHEDAVRHPSGIVARCRRGAFRSFDGYAVPNVRSAQFALQQGGDVKPVLTLPNAVDESLFDPSLVRQELVRRILGISPTDRMLAIVAALEPRKRVLECIQAFAASPESIRSRARLVVVGDGPLSASVRAAATADSRVAILGHQSANVVRDILAAADGFLLASSYDPNPLSVIEAGLSECYLMGVRTLGNADLISRCGGMVIDENLGIVSGVRAAICEFVEMPAPDLRERGQQARRCLLETNGRDVVARTLVDQLEREWPPGGNRPNLIRRASA